MIKKCLLLLVLTVGTVTLSNASSKYYVDDVSIDALFAQSIEKSIPANFVDFTSASTGFSNPSGTIVTEKSAMTALLLSWFFGYLGVHRFYLGSKKAGFIYLCTGGGCGILATVDMILLLMEAFGDKNISRFEGCDDLFMWNCGK